MRIPLSPGWRSGYPGLLDEIPSENEDAALAGSVPGQFDDLFRAGPLGGVAGFETVDEDAGADLDAGCQIRAVQRGERRGRILGDSEPTFEKMIGGPADFYGDPLPPIPFGDAIGGDPVNGGEFSSNVKS